MTSALSLEHALAAVIEAARLLPTETAEIDTVGGRYCSESISALRPTPPFDVSAMDGYAVAATPAALRLPLRIVGQALAGHPYAGEAIRADEAVRITTGGTMPAGAQWVVMQENVERQAGQIVALRGANAESFVRERGSDTPDGATIATRGQRLDAVTLARCVAHGVTRACVFQRPVVTVLSTGDELGAAGIADSNRPMLMQLLRDSGATVRDGGTLPDDYETIAEALRESAQHSDVVLTSGGVSVGDADYLGAVLQSLGQMHFCRVAVKPGKPFTQGKIGDRAHYFGLPGNPVSAMVTCAVFVLPYLRAIQGRHYQSAMDALPAPWPLPAAEALPKQAGRAEFQRVRVERGQLYACGAQDSHRLASLAQANALALLAPESTGAKVGDILPVYLFSELLAP